MANPYIVHIHGRMRHARLLQIGAWVMKLGARIAKAASYEYRIGNEPWQSGGRVKVGIQVELEQANK